MSVRYGENGKNPLKALKEFYYVIWLLKEKLRAHETFTEYVSSLGRGLL